MRRAGREPRSCRMGLTHQLLIVDRAIDHPPGSGVFRADRIGQHGECAGAGVAHKPRQDPGAARIGNKANAREGLQKLGRFRREHDIAGQRDIGAGPRSRAVDRTDDRLREIVDRTDQRIDSFFERLAKVRPGLARSKRAVGKVRPGAEASAGARNENRAAVGLRGSAGDSRRQRFEERGVQRVQALGSISE